MDRTLDEWISATIARGGNASEIWKMVMYEHVCGKSSITGLPLSPRAEYDIKVKPTTDPAALKLLGMAD